MNEPFEEMAIFAKIAETGSFTAAAKSLGRSKSYVSHQLTKLEEHLNIQLLFRTTRNLSLTEAGSVYLKHCQELIRAADDAKQSIAALQGEMTGLIRVSATNSFGELYIDDILTAFQEIHPAIQFNFDLSDTIESMKENQIDISIRGGTITDDELVAIPLIHWRMLIVGTPEYFEEHGTPNTPEDLKFHNCIGDRFKSHHQGWPFLIDGEIQRVKVEGNYSVGRNTLIKKRILSGKGLSRVPSYVVGPELRSGKLIRVLQEYEPKGFPFSLVYPYQKAMPLRQRRLIDFFKDWFSNIDSFDFEHLDTNEN